MSFDTELVVISRARLKTDPITGVDEVAVGLQNEFKLAVVVVELELENKGGKETAEFGEAVVCCVKALIIEEASLRWWARCYSR